MTISWDSVECIHRNGLITHYIFSYGRGRDGENNQMNVTVNITDQDDGGSFTASRIDPATKYIFKVAAVNEAGVGVFASVSTNGSGKLQTIIKINIQSSICCHSFNVMYMQKQ